MKNLQGIFILIISLIVGVFVTVSVLTGGGNSISSFARYLVIFVAALGFFGKKFPFYVLIFTGAYSDFLKRLLIIEGNFTQLDIMSVLAISPLLMFTLFSNNLIRFSFNARTYGKMPLIALFYGLVLLFITLAQGIRGNGDIFGLLQLGANVASYAFLPFCLLVTFSNMEELLRFLKTALIIFLPVPIHGLSQYFFGYNQIEYSYLASGMTSIVDFLDINRTRPFSTVSSPGSFALSCGFLAGLAFLFWRNKNLIKGASGKIQRIWNFPTLISILIVILFIAGMIASKSRTQILIGLTTVPLAYLYRSKLATLTSYFALAVLLLTLMFSSGYILENDLIAKYQTDVASGFNEATGIDNRYVTLATLTIRVEGFRNLVENPEFHTLFGSDAFSDINSMSDKKAARSAGVAQHNLISLIALRYGLLALALLALFATLILYFIHRQVLSIPRKHYQSSFARFGLALFFLSYAAAFVSGGAILANPVPLFLNISAGLVFFGLRERRDLMNLQEASEFTEQVPYQLSADLPA